MTKYALQVNYKLPIAPGVLPQEERAKIMPRVVEDAKRIAAVPGLRWKVYLMNQETGEVGGLYIFDDEASMKAYIDGPIMAERKKGMAFGVTIRDVSIKPWVVMEELTKITRGPI